MKRNSAKYGESDCFLVPLRSGGFARGVVARLSGDGIVFGYFFGPKFTTGESACLKSMPTPADAVLCGQFGDLGLLNGEWKVFAQIKPWREDEWPLPPFIRANAPIVSIYDDNLRFIREQGVEVNSASAKLPKDSVMGYGFVELRLTKLVV